MAQIYSRRWCLPIWLLLLAPLALATITKREGFKLYPEGARECLTKAAEGSGCDDDDYVKLDKCLCKNTGDFVNNTATCLGEEGFDDVQTVYRIMSNACSNSDAELAMDREEFLDLADEAETTSTSPPSPTKTSNKDDDEDKDDDDVSSGLSLGATIGTAVGAVLLGLSLLGTVGALVFRRFRRRPEEAQPMLSQGGSSVAMYPHSDQASQFPENRSPSPLPNAYYTAGSEPIPSPMFQGQDMQQFRYNSPADFYSAASSGQGEIRIEMEGSTGYHAPAAEMPGSSPAWR